VAPLAPLAVVGGRLATGLVELSHDLAVLETSGFWAVVISFDGRATCARFGTVRPARPWPGPPWRGPPSDAWRTSLDGPAFRSAVTTIRAAIAAGDVYQVNLTRRLSAPAPPVADMAALGAVLATGNPAPYSAVVRIPEVAIHVASASPECFLARRGRRVRSAPIKGTASAADGFLAKDRAENVMIVDLVRNDFGRVCRFGTITVPALCRVEAHPGLFHLVSVVEGELAAGNGWPELIAATFPPGSVTGAPKLAALASIAKLEPVGRGPYCGAVGWVDADTGEGELNVAIRTFWLEAGELHLGTGGAVTWDSTAEGEWAETELKTRRLLSVVSA